MMGIAAMGQNSKVNLIPQPVDLQVSTGSWTLDANAVIGYNKPEGKKVAEHACKQAQSTHRF